MGLENQARKAFVAAKKLLCQDCVLTHYDVSKPLKLYCDASASGLGACLVHQMPDRSERPVAYASRTLTAPEQNYAQIEHEALAIVFAIRRFHQYLYGRSFTLVTDHALCARYLVKRRVFHHLLLHVCNVGHCC